MPRVTGCALFRSTDLGANYGQNGLLHTICIGHIDQRPDESIGLSRGDRIWTNEPAAAAAAAAEGPPRQYIALQ